MDLDTIVYSSRGSMLEGMRSLVPAGATVAMEYSPGGALPIMSWVDGGTPSGRGMHFHGHASGKGTDSRADDLMPRATLHALIKTLTDVASPTIQYRT